VSPRGRSICSCSHNIVIQMIHRLPSAATHSSTTILITPCSGTGHSPPPSDVRRNIERKSALYSCGCYLTCNNERRRRFYTLTRNSSRRDVRCPVCASAGAPLEMNAHRKSISVVVKTTEGSTNDNIAECDGTAWDLVRSSPTNTNRHNIFPSTDYVGP